MALHKDFPESPYAILDPALRRLPADEARRGTGMDKLMPPSAPELRKKVKEWRDRGYMGATDTSRSLLNRWLKTPHLLPQTDGAMAEFQYHFAQREALETIIYLYDVVGIQDKFDLMRFGKELANQRSLVTLEITNLFNRRFFQALERFGESEPDFSPSRRILFKLALYY